MILTCFGLAIATRFTCGAMTAETADALPVASTTTMSSSERLQAHEGKRRDDQGKCEPHRLSKWTKHF